MATKKKSEKSKPARKTTRSKPAAAAPARPLSERPAPPAIEVDENSPPEVLFAAGRQRLPYFGDKRPRVTERRQEAVELLRRAAEAGHFGAIEMLAGGIDEEQAFAWAVTAARAGEAGHLTSLLTSGDLPVEEARSVLEAAQNGEPWAMYAVGCVYGLGMQDVATGIYVATQDGAWGWLPGVPDPDAEAERLLTRAADAGFATAALELATDLHREGKFADAFLRVKQAAAGDLSAARRQRAARLTARLLDDLEAPLSEQIEAYGQLAEGGDEDAMVWMARRYRDGDGVETDITRARALYERAAASGSVEGLRELGRMCEEGTGGPIDDQRARELYEQAAELGADPFARDRLAEKYGLTWYRRTARERRSRDT